MQHYAPARLRAPLLRTGPRGSGEFKEISWDEALALATDWLGGVRETDPKKLAFFTGRDQSQSLTGFWAQQFGTPNYAAHGGFCSVNMAAAGIMTIGGAFWEFGAPDWDRTKLFVLFGVAEDHDSNPLKIGISQAQEARRALRLGQSGAHRLFGGRRQLDRHPAGHRRAADPVARPRTAEGAEDRCRLSGALFERALAGDRCAGQRRARAVRARRRRQAAGLRDGHRARRADRHARARGRRCRAAVELADGRSAVPSFQLLAEKYLDEQYAPEAVAGETGVAADDHPRARRRDRPRRLRRGDLDRPALDRHARRAARRLCRPAGVVPRHARHLGPFQRLPDGARAAPPAGADRRGRLPRRLPLRAALSEAGRGASDAAWQGRAFRLEQAAVRPASRLSARPGGSADRRRRQAEPHRQGVLLGRAARPCTG